MTEQQFKTGLRMLEAEYVNLKITGDNTRYKIWANAFMGVDGRLFFKAIEKHIMDSEFPPNVASIMKHIKVAVPGGIEHLPPDEAFKKLCKLCRYYYDPEKQKEIRAGWKKDYPALYKTARNFDIFELAMMEIDEVPIIRAQFERYYKLHCERVDRDVEYAEMRAIATNSNSGNTRYALPELGGILKGME